MTKTSPLIMTLDVNADEVFTDTWFLVRVKLTRSISEMETICLRDMYFFDKNAPEKVRLDSDLMQRDLEIHPGESYVYYVKLKVSEVCEIDLANLNYVLAGDNESYHGDTLIVQVRPNLAKEISIIPTPICSYGNATKIKLDIEHIGETRFGNLRISVIPESALHSGKLPLRFESFEPGTKENALIAAEGDVSVFLTANVENGTDLSCEKKVNVGTITNEKKEPFRFLAPRRLSKDEIIVRHLDGERKRIPSVQSAFPLLERKKYQVFIKPPEDLGVTDIVLKDIPGRIYVRPFGFDETNNAWRFEIEITYKESFRRSDKLHYTVETSTSSLAGEIHLLLLPTWAKYFDFAKKFALTSMIQALFVLVHRVFAPGFSIFGLISEFDITRDYVLLFLFYLPVVLVSYWLFDIARHRLFPN